MRELFFKVFADDEDNFAETGTDGIIDRIVHDGFAIRTQPVQLFQTAITLPIPAANKKSVGFIFVRLKS